MTADECRVQIWNTATRVGLYRNAQDDVVQLELLDEDSNNFVALSREELAGKGGGSEDAKDGGKFYKAVCRNLVDGKKTHAKPVQCSIRFARNVCISLAITGGTREVS